MKKILFFIAACITCICVHANTCTYDGVEVSLYRESVCCDQSGAWIQVSTNKTNIRTVRCQISVSNKRVWVEIPIDEYGRGSANIKGIANLEPGMSYRVTLVAGAGRCY